MKITKIERQNRNKTRYNLFVDDKYYTSLSYETIVEVKLEEGRAVDNNKLQAAIQAQELKNSFDKSLKILSFRMNSVFEIKRKLKKEYSEEIINKTIYKLQELALLDDDKFSDLWVRERKSKRGRRVLKGELIKKGIDKERVEKALENFSKEEEVVSATVLLKKKFKDSQVEIDKKFRYLANRGYDYEIAKRAINKEN